MHSEGYKAVKQNSKSVCWGRGTPDPTTTSHRLKVIHQKSALPAIGRLEDGVWLKTLTLGFSGQSPACSKAPSGGWSK